MSLRKALGDAGCANRSGFPAPEETESLAVPTGEGIKLDVHQGVAPREQAAQNYHNQPSGIIGAVWLHLPLLEQGELFTQEDVLGSQCAARPRNEHEEVDEIARDGNVLRLYVSGWKTEPGINASLTRDATLRDCRLAAGRSFCGAQARVQ